MTMNKNFLVADTKENFGELLDDFFQGQQVLEKCFAKGHVRVVGTDDVLVDVRSPAGAYVAEGYIDLKEFQKETKPAEGDVIDIYVERLDGPNGQAALSYEKAKREAAWKTLEEKHEKKEIVEGVITDRVKGGFTVNVFGLVAFLPGSQLDVRPLKDVTYLMNVPLEFHLIRMDRARSNIVVSRRSVMEAERSESRSDLISKLQVGQVVKGVVKNIKSYGAFVDLGSVDGLLHITDMSWKRIEDPESLLSVDQEIEVKIIRFNQENHHISLSLKELEEDPWKHVESKYQVGSRVKGKITTIHGYGAFVELEPGIEGLIHVSEMSWKKKPIVPSNLFEPGQEVEAVILLIESSRRRLCLGLKQCQESPWKTIQDNHRVGQVIDVVVQDVRDFGVFVQVVEGVDGIIYRKDLSWDEDNQKTIQNYEKGHNIKAKILTIDPEKEQISLGVKQLTEGERKARLGSFSKDDVVTCEVVAIHENGIDVLFGENIKGFIKRGDLSRDRSEQRTDRFAVGEKLDAQIIRGGEPMGLSIKARELLEERSIVSEYGSSDSGATLGEILGVSPSKRGAQLLEEVEKKKK